tara:strand:- start:73 stop:3471 length:3399 start_codon:yes stop_codon:yes gene_type:complete
MALGFGKFKFNNFRGACGSYFTIDIYKKNYSDNDNNGDPVLYPEVQNAREFANNPTFITYWTGQGVTIPGWSWSSDYGGSALHTAGNTDSLVYVFDYDILVSGQQYEVTIELNGISSPAANKQIVVQLGTASTDAYTENGTYTSIVTANGGQLSLNPNNGFAGNVVSISLKKYFAPATEFKTQGDGFHVTWNGQGGTRNRRFLASECKIFYLVEDQDTENFLYSIVSGGIKEYYVRIYRSTFPYGTEFGTAASEIFWYGYIMPAFDAIENAPFPYVFTITANDSYGLYGKKEVQNFADEDAKTTRHSVRNILREFIVNNDLNDIEQTISAGDAQKVLNTNIDWWQTIDTYGSFNPALRYHVAKGFVTKPTTYTDTGEIDYNNKPFEYKEIDVFNGVLQAFNLTGMQSDGGYWFVQPNSFINKSQLGVAQTYQYTHGGNVQTAASPINLPYWSVVTMNSVGSADQTNTKILAGSTISYEPSLRKVNINYEPGFSNFSISQGQDLTTEFYAGSLQTGTGGYILHFEAEFKERVNNGDFVFDAPINGISWRLIDSSYRSTGSLKIKITDGTTTKYLIATEQNLEWQTSVGSIVLYRGYNSPTDSSVNNPGELALGIVHDNIPTNINGNSTGPCQVYGQGTTRLAITQFKFEGIMNDPGISGDIFIEFDVTNNYYQAVHDTPTGVNPEYTWSYNNLNDPTAISSSCKAQNITLSALDEDNEDVNVANGIKYEASQNELEAFESEDLGNIRLGRNVNSLMYAIQYDSDPTIGQESWKSIQDFQRGNPTPDNPFNPTQLLINEYLQMGIEPLEILQADLRSKTYSPRKILVYSINDDGNFKYYAFMGGTYKAAQEVMSGEWYKIADNTDDEVVTETPVIVEPNTPPIDQAGTGLKPARIQKTISDTIKENALGVTSTDITNGTTYNKINFAINIKGRVYDNQKLLLTYPDGTNQLVLTANGGNAVTETEIDVDSFTPNISYPIGSVLSALIYDFTNVITAGTSTPNLYKGVTTTAIYIRPDEFVVPSSSSFSMYSRDEMASVQPSSYVNRSHVYATSFVPLNYRLTAVDVYMDQNRGYSILEGTHSGSGTTSLDTGVANTTETLSTAWTSVEGKYIILEINFGGTDKIYGAKLTIQAV